MQKNLKPVSSSRKIKLLNSCAVTAQAGKDIRKRAEKIRAKDSESLIVVVGCGAQVETELYEKNSAVDLVIGNSDRKNLKPIIENFLLKQSQLSQSQSPQSPPIQAQKIETVSSKKMLKSKDTQSKPMKSKKLLQSKDTQSKVIPSKSMRLENTELEDIKSKFEQSHELHSYKVLSQEAQSELIESQTVNPKSIQSETLLSQKVQTQSAQFQSMTSPVRKNQEKLTAKPPAEQIKKSLYLIFLNRLTFTVTLFCLTLIAPELFENSRWL